MAVAVLGGIGSWRGREILAISFWVVGGALILAATLVPRSLGPIQRAWMGMAHAISGVTTPIFMAVVYFVVMAPTGLLMRAFGRNALTAHHGDTSVWVSRGESRRGDLERQF